MFELYSMKISLAEEVVGFEEFFRVDSFPGNF